MNHDETRNTARLTLIAGVALGALAVAGPIAFGAGWMLRTPARVEVQRPPTADELAQACQPDLQQVQDELGTAQTRVATLEREVAAKTAEANELQARIAKNAEGGKSLRAELERVKAELAQTKEQLAVAEAEKERLLVELTQTKEELEETKVELVQTQEQRDQAREDAVFNRWNQFLADSQLEICEKGNRKKLGNCRESVTATLGTDARRDAFAHCLRSGQAAPLVRELEKNASMPDFSEMIDEETKQVKGWYVELCDPTLPELADIRLAEDHLPKTSTARPPEG